MPRMARICALVAVLCTMAPGALTAADLLTGVDEAYAFRQLRRTPFERGAARQIEPSEARFLEALFASTDEAVLLNTDVDRWLTSDGERGLHPVDYLERMDALRARLDGLQAPGRIASIHRYVTRSLELQRSFVAEWHRAREQGRELESQRTDEFAYHEGLHRSRRLLLKAFAELRALYPDAEEDVYRAFHDHLRAVAL